MRGEHMSGLQSVGKCVLAIIFRQHGSVRSIDIGRRLLRDLLTQYWRLLEQGRLLVLLCMNYLSIDIQRLLMLLLLRRLLIGLQIV